MRALRLSAIAAMLGGAAVADTKQASDDKSFLDHAALLAPIRVDSLALVPIVGDGKPGATANDDLLVLDEAMRAKLVRITEFDEGNVNSLKLQNRADKPVFLLAGEVIIGGKQDRIIGRNTIIPAKTTQDVPVYCVEHGRWEVQTNEFASANALAHGRLRAQASYASQQAVWDEVAAKNAERKITVATGTYRTVAAQQAGGSSATWEKRIDGALAKIPAKDRERMIGYAVAINGKVATIDVFGSPRLFRKLEGKLVRSYVTDALGVKAEAAAKMPTKADVEAFAAEADNARAERSYETNFSDTEVQLSGDVAASKVTYKPGRKPKPANPTPAVAEPPAADTPVYSNYQKR